MENQSGRILQRIENNKLKSYQKKAGYNLFRTRLSQQFPHFLEQLFELYGNRRDFLYQVEDIVESLCIYSLKRSTELKKLDSTREIDTTWYLSEKMAGFSLYVDLFSGSLERLPEFIPYFKDLGITSVHLMPIYSSPQKENDGGYAVSSYREIDSRYGTAKDLENVSSLFRQNGMSLVLDFILNHTASNHAWAKKAREGSDEYKDYYIIFNEKSTADEYNATLRDIFPEKRSGSFTYCKDVNGWVWTTFNDFQWDLNYANPVVFRKMLEEMLSLANLGVEILRFDALAFIWKEKGTSCENQPKAHTLIKAFKTAARIAAPGVVFKSEAIVHPDDVRKYISKDECELSYNPLLMATLWESLATREVALLKKSMEHYARCSKGCAWVNYIRCHDDIGWTFSDDDAWSIGINPHDHRMFLNNFYTGLFEGSFARGLPFQKNEETGDTRISGTCASLAGIEKAFKEETRREVDLAVKRILLMYGIIFSMNGYPLIYAGDELGLLNDYSYTNDPAKQSDSRWVHRQRFPWKAKRDKDAASESNINPPHRKSFEIYRGVKKMLQIRKNCQVFAGEGLRIIDLRNPHVFGFIRSRGAENVTVLANFSETTQSILYAVEGVDLLTGDHLSAVKKLKPYELHWIQSTGEVNGQQLDS